MHAMRVSFSLIKTLEETEIQIKVKYSSYSLEETEIQIKVKYSSYNLIDLFLTCKTFQPIEPYGMMQNYECCEIVSWIILNSNLFCKELW